ncbi:peptide transporter [Sulfurimonas sp. MAG313]|nr:STT3 domain-containing protein [Sulfurimonas sp. MAG313]MDF1881212.1 peptide transporter [Sulfurimonas sp. MAG313]
MQEFLKLDQNKLELKYFFILLLIAFSFSIAIRMIWVEQFSGMEEFKWNSQLMINTNDGYYYAEGARDILLKTHQENDSSPITSPLSQLTSFLAYIVPVSFETLILFMSAFFSSLLVIPIMLIGRTIKQDNLGFISALVSGIAWSYYNRTMTGYYDTDMLVIVLPTIVLYGVIQAVSSHRNRWLVLITISMILNAWWYPGSYSLNMAMIAIVFLYTMAFERKNVYFYKILLFMALAAISLPIYTKVLIAIGLFLWFHFKSIKDLKIVLGLLTLSFIAVAFTGGLGPILSQLDAYIFRSTVSSTTGASLHFYNVAQTVREAGKIPFETFANRISGHTITFLLSTLGYILLSLRYRVMWLALPMMALGFLALKGGLRFTVYAVPINALGIAYLIVFMSQKVPSAFKYLVLILGSTAVLYPNITHIIAYRVPTVFNNLEVKVLDSLNKNSSREDYVLAWWDYGYPIRYYADVKTLIDGGKHSGDSNFPVSYALFEEQAVASKMARLAVEYTESAFKQERKGSYIQMMMDDNNISDPNDFLLALEQGLIPMPKKTRDVYFYLPLRMLNILPTVGLFSNLDLATGKAKVRPFFFQSQNFKQVGNEIILSGNFKIDMKNGNLIANDQVVPINSFLTTQYDKNRKFQVQRQEINPSAPMTVIYMKDMNRFLVLDAKMFNSSYIQMFVLEQYDKNLFEMSISTPLVKVFKLKI